MNSEQTMELLAKLLDDRQFFPAASKAGKDTYDKLAAYYEQKVQPLLAHASYSKRDELLSHVEGIIQKWKFWLLFPGLYGKKLIGFRHIGKKSPLHLLQRILKADTLALLSLNQNVLTMLLPEYGEDSIGFLNTAEHFATLSQNEYKNVERQLWQQNIDIGQLLEGFSMGIGNTLPGSTALWIPRLANLRMPLSQFLNKEMDAVFLLNTDTDKNSLMKKCCNEAEKYAAQHIPAYLYTGEKLVQFGDGTRKELDPDQFFNILYDIVSDNRSREELLPEKLENEKMDWEWEILGKKKKIQDLLDQLKRDLVGISSGSTATGKRIKNWQGVTEKEKDGLEQEEKKINTAFRKLFSMAQELDRSLRSKDNSDVVTPAAIRLQDQYLLAKLFFKKLDCGYEEEAWEILRSLKQQKFWYDYALEALYDKATNEAVPEELKERLRQSRDNELIRKVKLRLIQELGFSVNDAMQIARDIRKLDTPLEYYYRGVWEESIKNMSAAQKMYLSAYYAGYTAAGTALVQLSKRPDTSAGLSLSELAERMLIPEACAEYGRRLKHSQKHSQPEKANFYLKVAASYKDLDSIRELAFDLWKQLKDENADSGRIATCKDLFGYVLQQKPNDTKTLKQLGYLFKKQGDGKRALQYWERAGTGQSMYECGRLYQYGNRYGNYGIMQDLDKAEEYFKKAVSKGYSKAETELKKVQEWKEKNKKQREERKQQSSVYHEDSDYSIHIYSTRGSSDSCCHLVTAACQALHIDQRRYHRTVYIVRHMRNVAEKKQPDNLELIQAYYDYSSDIVDAINEGSEKRDEYQNLWQNYILPCVQATRKRQYGTAWKLYIGMCYNTAKKYHVNLPRHIYNKAEAALERK